MLTKIKENIFYLFIFLLPWQTVFILREVFINNEKFQYGSVNIFIYQLILLLLILLNYKKIFKFEDKKIIFILGLFLSWLFLTIFQSSDKILSFYFFSLHLLGAFLFLIIQNLNINFKKLSFSIILSTTLSSILGLYQFFTQTAFSSKWLGLSDHLAWQGGSSVIATESFRFLRAYGSMPHPNIMGGLLTIVLLLSLGAYIKASRSEIRWKMFLVATLPLNLLSLLTTFSRSAFLALVVGIILIVSYFLFKEKIPRKKDLWVIFYSLIILTALFFTAYSDIFSSRTQNENRLEKKSLTDRKIYLQDAREIIRQDCFSGTGPGNYTLTVLKNKKTSRKIWEIQPVHNLYLLVFSEIGFLGFAFFFSFVAIILSEIFQKFKSRKSNTILFSFLLITLLFSAFFDHWIWTGAFGIILFWLILALSKKETLFT